MLNKCAISPFMIYMTFIVFIKYIQTQCFIPRMNISIQLNKLVNMKSCLSYKQSLFERKYKTMTPNFYCNPYPERYKIIFSCHEVVTTFLYSFYVYKSIFRMQIFLFKMIKSSTLLISHVYLSTDIAGRSFLRFSNILSYDTFLLQLTLSRSHLQIFNPLDTLKISSRHFYLIERCKDVEVYIRISRYI